MDGVVSISPPVMEPVSDRTASGAMDETHNLLSNSEVDRGMRYMSAPPM